MVRAFKTRLARVISGPICRQFVDDSRDQRTNSQNRSIRVEVCRFSDNSPSKFASFILVYRFVAGVRHLVKLITLYTYYKLYILRIIWR